VVELANPGLPNGLDCQASAQNTTGVTSGGGGLTGAAELLGMVSLANATEFNLFPGVYDINVHCISGDGTWQAEEQAVSVQTDQDMNLILELRQTP
jgi:hypothetical protein